MSDSASWVTLLGIELVIVIFAYLLFSWFRAHRMMRRDRKAVSDLISRVRAAKAQREQVLNSFLSENVGQQGELLEQSTVKLQRAELSLLQRFADIYRARDAGAAAQFFIDLEATLAAYHELYTDGAILEPVADSDDSDHLAELERLRKENARLSEELSVSMDTMSRMLNEYSTMFSTTENEEAAQAPPVLENLDELPEDELPEMLPEEPLDQEAVESVANDLELEPAAEPELTPESNLDDDLDDSLEPIELDMDEAFDEPLDKPLDQQPLSDDDLSGMDFDSDLDEFLVSNEEDDDTMALSSSSTEELTEEVTEPTEETLQVEKPSVDLDPLDELAALGVDDIDALFDTDDLDDQPNQKK